MPPAAGSRPGCRLRAGRGRRGGGRPARGRHPREGPTRRPPGCPAASTTGSTACRWRRRAVIDASRGSRPGSPSRRWCVRAPPGAGARFPAACRGAPTPAGGPIPPDAARCRDAGRGNAVRAAVPGDRDRTAAGFLRPPSAPDGSGARHGLAYRNASQWPEPAANFCTRPLSCAANTSPSWETVIP